MTINEAEHILDIVSAALQDESHPYGHPVSALQGYDLFDIITALKLRIANEYLLFYGQPDFEELFSEGIRLYDSVPWSIMGTFVADDDVGKIGAKRPMCMVDRETMALDKRFASMESGSQFGNFCKSLSATDPDYWRHVYEHIGIGYTPYSPHGNEPVKVS
jgi:hypothetical protein